MMAFMMAIGQISLYPHPKIQPLYCYAKPFLMVISQ